MQELLCDTCQTPAKKPNDVKSFTCGVCSARAVIRLEQEKKQYRQSLDPEDIKRVRKETLGWTQKRVDIKLGLTSNHTNRVENGHILPDKKLVDFIYDNM